MTTPEAQNRWASFAQNYPTDLIPLGDAVIAAYTQKHRAYHNLRHIQELLDLLERAEHLVENKALLLWAIWYHDVVYQPQRKDNEAQSADWALRDMLAVGLSRNDAEKVHAWIVATLTHEVPAAHQCIDVDILMDIDLAILASAPPEYIQYTKQIRQEYKWVPGCMYRKGRKQVLEHFLQMDPIYKTDWARNQWEALAKENLKTEIASLS